MALVLHVLKADDHALALPVIARQVEAGDRVTVVLVHGAARPSLPASVPVHRVPDDLSYRQLLDLVFAADQVMAW
jgi:hypothetical protein